MHHFIASLKYLLPTETQKVTCSLALIRPQTPTISESQTQTSAQSTRWLSSVCTRCAHAHAREHTQTHPIHESLGSFPGVVTGLQTMPVLHGPPRSSSKTSDCDHGRVLKTEGTRPRVCVCVTCLPKSLRQSRNCFLKRKSALSAWTKCMVQFQCKHWYTVLPKVTTRNGELISLSLQRKNIF